MRLIYEDFNILVKIMVKTCRNGKRALLYVNLMLLLWEIQFQYFNEYIRKIGKEIHFRRKL